MEQHATTRDLGCSIERIRRWIKHSSKTCPSQPIVAATSSYALEPLGSSCPCRNDTIMRDLPRWVILLSGHRVCLAYFIALRHALEGTGIGRPTLTSSREDGCLARYHKTSLSRSSPWRRSQVVRTSIRLRDLRTHLIAT